MNTPICDFVREYGKKKPHRFHMPGHKGNNLLGFENLDITEIDGADSLYEADGIIKISEENASGLFGSLTFYSTEGSSQCIKAMLHLLCLNGNKKPLIWAGRNAHKSFLSACVLSDFDIEWLYPDENSSYLSCKLDGERLGKELDKSDRKPDAVYVTSPDYLGNISDIKSLASVCHENGILLLVDNAHGAYLKFLPESLHPMDLGADMCTDSAHKTLPVLTGGAYLHLSERVADIFKDNVKSALGLFGSTSPSYLILQSLDMANKYLDDGYREKLSLFTNEVSLLKNELKNKGYTLIEDEPLKITIDCKKYGYTGYELAENLKDNKIICEFCDPDFLVLMLTPDLTKEELEVLREVLIKTEKREEILISPPLVTKPKAICSPRVASFSEREIVPVSESSGRVLASSNVGCPPAVPIIVSGEEIDESTIKAFEYYNIKNCTVIKNNR